MLMRWNERAMPSRTIFCGGRPTRSRPSNDTEPLVGPEMAGDEVEEGRLAGAIGADDGMGFAGLEVERDVARGDEAGEGLPQPPYLASGAAWCSCPLPRLPVRPGTRHQARK